MWPPLAGRSWLSELEAAAFAVDREMNDGVNSLLFVQARTVERFTVKIDLPNLHPSGLYACSQACLKPCRLWILEPVKGITLTISTSHVHGLARLIP